MEKRKYHFSVPKEIVELMGDKQYAYIRGFDNREWPGAYMEPKPELKTTSLNFYTLPQLFGYSLEDSLISIQDALNDPNYVSSDIDFRDGDVSITSRIDNPETDEFLERIKKYEEEEQLFEKLKVLIADLSGDYNYWKTAYEEKTRELDEIYDALRR
jgi:hypothetical protein